jgi:hypothetical protein
MSSIACARVTVNRDRHHAPSCQTQDVQLIGFRRALRGLSTKYLHDHVDGYLVAWDQARERGGGDLIDRTEAECNAVWDGIDRRDDIVSRVAL